MTKRGDAIRVELQTVDSALGLVPPDSGFLSASSGMAEDLKRHREALMSQLPDAGVGVLDVVFDGASVHGHSVEVELLVDTLGPFQHAVASVGQIVADEATTAGLIPASILEQ